MLDDWKLSNYLSLKHLKESLSDLVPVGYATNIIENGRALTERYTLFNLANELNASEIHKVI